MRFRPPTPGRRSSADRLPFCRRLVASQPLGAFCWVGPVRAACHVRWPPIPTSKVTFSSSPSQTRRSTPSNARTSSARRWSTDEWNLYLVNCRSACFSCVVWSGWSGYRPGPTDRDRLRLPDGGGPDLGSGGGRRSCIGRLCRARVRCQRSRPRVRPTGVLEDMVVLGLVLGTAVLARDDRLTWALGRTSGAW